jgi:Family of unknown function (DUF5343)
MALTNAYVLPVNRIADLFRKIQDGQAPERFTHQLLKDWGFTSTNDRAFIQLLKAPGFLTADGHPTRRYLEYRDHSRSKQALGQAMREAYGEVFLIKEHPTASDRRAIEGKFKSFHNVSDNVAGLMAKTFFGLLPLADLSANSTSEPTLTPLPTDRAPIEVPVEPRTAEQTKMVGSAGLHYNIQIHLPATKDVEVYNAIFKSLREHLFE